MLCLLVASVPSVGCGPSDRVISLRDTSTTAHQAYQRLVVEHDALLLSARLAAEEAHRAQSAAEIPVAALSSREDVSTALAELHRLQTLTQEYANTASRLRDQRASCSRRDLGIWSGMPTGALQTYYADVVRIMAIADAYHGTITPTARDNGYCLATVLTARRDQSIATLQRGAALSEFRDAQARSVAAQGASAAARSALETVVATRALELEQALSGYRTAHAACTAAEVEEDEPGGCGPPPPAQIAPAPNEASPAPRPQADGPGIAVAPGVPGGDVAPAQPNAASTTGSVPSAGGAEASPPAPATASVAELEWVAMDRAWSRLLISTTECDEGQYDDIRAHEHMLWRPVPGVEVRITIALRSVGAESDAGINSRIVALGEWEGTDGPQVLAELGPFYEHGCGSAQASTGFAGQRTDGRLLISLERLPQAGQGGAGAPGQTHRVVLEWDAALRRPASRAVWSGLTRDVPQLFRTRPPRR